MLSVASCSRPTTSSPGCRKRKNDENDGTAVPGSKLLKEYHQYYFVLESDDKDSSSEDTGSGSSVSSIHNKSTDFAKTTSDTSSKADESDGDLAGVEYEVASLPETESAAASECLSSGTDPIQWKDGAPFSSEQSEGEEEKEKAAWADGSSDASVAPSPPPPASVNSLKLRNCLRCKSRTALLRFCRSCHQNRKNSFTPRPKRKTNKKPNRSRLKSVSKACEAKHINKQVSSTQELLTSSSTQEPLTSSSSQEILEIPSALEPNTDNVCGMCFINPKNGAFNHGKWVHIIACYKCSLKIWFSRKCCPLCNGKINQVSQVATS